VLDRLVSRIVWLLGMDKVNSLFGRSCEPRSAALTMRGVVVCTSHGRFGHNHLSLRLVLQRLLVLLGRKLTLVLYLSRFVISLLLVNGNGMSVWTGVDINSLVSCS